MINYGKFVKPLIFSFLFFPLSLQSTPLDVPPRQSIGGRGVVINEIAWMGTEVERVESKNWWRYEWLELYNTTNWGIDISGWKIENASAKNKPLEIPTGEIPPKGLFLICKKEIKNCDFVTWALSLNNDYKENGKLILRDTLNNLIDQTLEPENKEWPAGSYKTWQTMERKNPQLEGSNSDNWQTSRNEGGTPRAKNSLVVEDFPSPAGPEIEPEPLVKQKSNEAVDIKPQQIIYPTGVVVNEILPSPEGSDKEEEWIEIFNQNNFEVDLSNWQIADTVGKTTTFTFLSGTKISPQGFLAISRPTTKITLNNDGDGLNLIQPDGKIIDSVIYEKASRGQSYNKIDSHWAWGNVLTPGSANVISKSVAEKKETATLEKEVKKEIKSERELAAIGEQFPEEKSNFFLILLIAPVIAIFSGIIILFLKNKLKAVDLRKKLE